jgi:hypothetical protein
MCDVWQPVMVAYILDSWSYTNSVGTEACVYVIGPCYGLFFWITLSRESAVHCGNVWTWLRFHYDVHNVIYATQTHSCVKSKLKLRLKNNAETKFSWPYVCRKPKIKKPETQKPYSLFTWGFIQDHRKWTWNVGRLWIEKSGFYCTSASAVIDKFTVWILALTIG